MEGKKRKTIQFSERERHENVPWVCSYDIFSMTTISQGHAHEPIWCVTFNNLQSEKNLVFLVLRGLFLFSSRINDF